MRILILNWRCPRHPKAGGAELFTQEMARRWAANGDNVEWFSAAYSGSLPEETIDGVHFIRAGRQWTVHAHAIWRYRGKLKGRFDAVIDEVNTMPFFTPLWAQVPHYMLIYQLAREVWWYESPFPLNAIGYIAEPIYLRSYRRSPAFTISRSTKQDLLRMGHKGQITILPQGVEHIEKLPPGKELETTFLYVGRLTPSKRVDHVLRAFAAYRAQAGKSWLNLVGEGPRRYEQKLRRLIGRLGISSDVRVLGRVSNAEKHRLMSRAHALLMASTREGWGLVVGEANACGTPAVVYDVPGLRDAVINGTTGLVVTPTPAKLADGMIDLLSDEGVYRRISEEATRWASDLSFDHAAALLRDQITQRSGAVSLLPTRVNADAGGK